MAQRSSRTTTDQTWLVTLRNLLGVVYQGCCCDLPRVLDGLMHNKAMGEDIITSYLLILVGIMAFFAGYLDMNSD